MDYCVYILQSISDTDKIYIGYTSHLILRMREHNYSDFDRKAYTRKFRPWFVIYVEYYETKSDAMNREKWLKSGVGREWISKNIQSW
jgi:putative endonuclease